MTPKKKTPKRKAPNRKRATKKPRLPRAFVIVNEWLLAVDHMTITEPSLGAPATITCTARLPVGAI